MITVLIGKSGSGKTTLANELAKAGYEQIVTYTTRPRRRDESPDAYHFIQEQEFLDKIKEGFFAEWDSYDTVKGKWYYGSALEDYVGDKIIILTPKGLFEVQKKVKDVFSIYIYANRTTLEQRLKKRGDNQKEVARRAIADEEDFRGVENKVDKIIYNNYELSDALDKIKIMVKR